MKICVCTLAINDWYANIVKYSIRGKKEYCKKHGYDFYMDNTIYDGEREPMWYKIKTIKHLLSTNYYDYIVWLDADSHILGTNIKLEKYIVMMAKYDLLLGRDSNSLLTTSVIFVKNTDYSKTLMDLIWDNPEPFEKNFHEQASLSDLYKRDVEECQKHVKILPQNMQNEFLTYWYMYYPKQCFIFHAARCAHDREGFIYTLDLFCPMKMDEETQEQYTKRMEWLYTPEKCRKTIDNFLNKRHEPRVPSARNAHWFR